MGWQIKRISSNKERAGESIRKALESAAHADKNGGRGYGSVASAVETALQAFGSINGYSVEIVTAGDISADGKGYLTISLVTIDQDVIV
jgi:hypothetical protein